MTNQSKLIFRLIVVTLSIAIAFAINACNKTPKTTIVANFKMPSEGWVYLEKLSFSGKEVVDSTDYDKGSSKLRFRVVQPAEPTFYVLNFGTKGAVTLLTQQGDEVVVDIKMGNERISSYTVAGSQESEKVLTLVDELSKTRKQYDSLQRIYLLSQDRALKTELFGKMSALVDSQRVFNTRFIWKNSTSKASVMAVYQKFNDQSYLFDRSEDLIIYKAVASSMMALYPESDYTKGMLADIGRIQKLISGHKVSQLIQSAEATLPEINLPTPKGDTVALSSLKGKVILLDFWASWSQSSMLDNRELLNVYNKFKGKGFEIYQVSLDRSKEEWVAAIEAGNLPWINVSELNPNGSYAASVYNVSQIPSNYLIDKNFDIVGKNLYGQELVKKLNSLLN